MKTTIELNATRLFAHCDCSYEILRDLAPMDFLVGRGDDVPDIGSHTLNGDDNYVVDAQVRSAALVRWPEVVALCIRKSQDYLAYAFAPPGQSYASTSDDDDWESGRRQPIQFRFGWRQWTLSQLETYWEFRTDDAVADVYAITSAATEIARDISRAEYRVENATSRHENSIALNIGLGRQNVKLAIYAKAPRRVRCEVRHLANPRLIYGHLQEVQELSTDRVDNLYRLIELVNGEARSRASRFMDAIWSQNVRPSATMVRMAMFLGHVASACGSSYSLINQVLSTLVVNGRATKAGSDEFCDAIEDLYRRGVLRRVRATTRPLRSGYTIARPYASVIEALRQQIPTSEVDMLLRPPSNTRETSSQQ